MDVLGGDSGGFDALALFTSTKDPMRERPVITPGLSATIEVEVYCDPDQSACPCP